MTIPVGSGYSKAFSMSSATSLLPQLSAEEKEYVQRLIALPLDSIVNHRSGEKKCEDIGQEIFNKAKAAHNGDSLAAKDVVTRIYNAIYFNQSDSQEDANFRKQYIECAWSGIGDDTWRWRWQCCKTTHDESCADIHSRNLS
ncbi:hypothetical protein [Candidatus Rhabdochlamydia sp. T3358]|uniref:hypothetical protein n=1 Tax=Candidatus Rhabdochlamydia sp. T3358 TaxID=2099795 RepID=UPI0010BC9273|nr:hypothetical protein [Candidatus Rhabdochlamydia sp. T3358]VHO03352.1 hypothetical protein RHT_00870 [Candidatus Rhabdochlamydia sp. T3358]